MAVLRVLVRHYPNLRDQTTQRFGGLGIEGWILQGKRQEVD